MTAHQAFAPAPRPATRIWLALTALSLLAPLPALAQVAGSTTASVSLTERHAVAMGWSAKRSVLGKNVYTEAGQKIGQVQDIIIAPGGKVSYLIIGAGGFVGIGRHDVAVPAAQVRDHGGRLEMPGATQDVIRTIPRFAYANDTAVRDHFIAAATQDIARARRNLVSLQKTAGLAEADARVKLQVEVDQLQRDVQVAEGKLAELQNASVSLWKDFQAGLSEAVDRLHSGPESAVPG
ncbi:MAG: PRC-barrel domain-containing protein [Aquabacterium sp.]|nr:PRC-barrel domain-containing protein [Aquabacterium sp.]